jgi:iron-sulfur cluster assembly protein
VRTGRRGTKSEIRQNGVSEDRNQMQISITPTAIDTVQKFIEEQGDDVQAAGLRVAVLPGGCSGFQYGLNIEGTPADDDEIVEVNGLRVFVDPFSAQYLEGVEIDYVTTMMGSGFTFRNPNASGGCGCGSSFTV